MLTWPSRFCEQKWALSTCHWNCFKSPFLALGRRDVGHASISPRPSDGFSSLKDLCLRLPHHTVCFRHFSAFSKPCVRQSAFTLAKEVLITDVSLVLRDKFGFFRLWRCKLDSWSDLKRGARRYFMMSHGFLTRKLWFVLPGDELGVFGDAPARETSIASQ